MNYFVPYTINIIFAIKNNRVQTQNPLLLQQRQLVRICIMHGLFLGTKLIK